MFDIETTKELEAIIAEYKAEHDGRDFDYYVVSEEHSYNLQRAQRGTNERVENCHDPLDGWFNRLSGRREATFCYGGWRYLSFEDEILEDCEDKFSLG